MPYLDVIWTDDNVAHLGEHDVSPWEAEEVLQDPDFSVTSRESGRPMAVGHTANGRRLAVIYDLIDPITVYPITAYDID